VLEISSRRRERVRWSLYVLSLDYAECVRIDHSTSLLINGDSFRIL